MLAHPAADIKNYLMGQGIEFKGTVKPAPACCPLCQKKNCFGLLPGKEGGWLYKCHVPTCEGFKSGGIARFVEIQNRVDWKTARSMLHELTGIPDPYKMQDDKPHEGKMHEDQAGGDDPTDGSKTGGEPDWGEPPPTEEAGEERRYMKIPELGRNVYETFWAELELTPEHRAELKKKRGMSDGWIDALGLVSATRSNLEKLMPLLEKFPEKELLKLGLAQLGLEQRNNRAAR